VAFLLQTLHWSLVRISTTRKEVYPVACHEGTEGEFMYSSIISLTSALDWGGCLAPRSGLFTTKKTRYPLYRSGWAPEPIWKISPPPGIDPRSAQSIGSRYTGWVIPAPLTTDIQAIYKVVQIWPVQTMTCLHTNSPGHIWTTFREE
jgi:hypothetical protein